MTPIVDNPNSAAYAYTPEGETKLFSHANLYEGNFEEIYAEYTIFYMQYAGQTDEFYVPPSEYIPDSLIDPNKPIEEQQQQDQQVQQQQQQVPAQPSGNIGNLLILGVVGYLVYRAIS